MKSNNSKLFVILPVVAFSFLMLTAFEFTSSNQTGNTPSEETFSIPEDVQGILDKSCFGCHNVESGNDKGKKKLMFDELSNLSKAKLIGKLGGISETVEKNEMPPKKFLDKYPDKALTEEEAKRLMEWADNSADELLK